MNGVERFFRRYVFSTLGLLALLFAANVAVLAGLLLVGEMTVPTTFSISAFCDNLTGSGGDWKVNVVGQQMLDEREAWAMVLDPAGQVAWKYRLPPELDHPYTAGDIARFSRSYLEDWPVTVWAQEDGSLVVVGSPKGSMVKYYVSLDRDYMDLLTVLASAIFYTNLLLVVGLFIRSTRRVEKAMGPILNAIRGLADGKPQTLKEVGELAEISASLNRAASYIAQKDNTRAEWIRGISHDIRTPLSVILGYASQLEEDPALPEVARSQAGVIRRQGEKLTSLVADLNLTTKLEYALRPVERKPLDPVELARQAVSEVLNSGLPDRYVLEFAETDPDCRMTVAGDGALLERMLFNLVRNCIDHNPEGCRIAVSVTPDAGGGCCFTVTDDGVGVSPQRLASLNRGAPVASTQAAVPGGAEHGLGLRIVRQIVQAHRARLHFAQTQPHGLTVTVHLPA